MAQHDSHEIPQRRRSDRHEAAHEGRNQPTHLHWTPEDDEDFIGRFGKTVVYQEANPRYHPIRQAWRELRNALRPALVDWIFLTVAFGLGLAIGLSWR